MKINKRKMVRNKHNIPGIIKYLFWQMTATNPKATYACINYGEAYGFVYGPCSSGVPWMDPALFSLQEDSAERNGEDYAADRSQI